MIRCELITERAPREIDPNQVEMTVLKKSYDPYAENEEDIVNRLNRVNGDALSTASSLESYRRRHLTSQDEDYVAGTGFFLASP